MLDESRLNYFRQTFTDHIQREYVKDGVDDNLSPEPACEYSKEENWKAGYITMAQHTDQEICFFQQQPT